VSSIPAFLPSLGERSFRGRFPSKFRGNALKVPFLQQFYDEEQSEKHANDL
jgi:hypothetical protein